MNHPPARRFVHFMQDDQAIADGASIVQLERLLRQMIQAGEQVLSARRTGALSDAHVALSDAIETAKAHLS